MENIIDGKVREVVPGSQSPESVAYLNRILSEAREFERFAEARSRLTTDKIHRMALAAVGATLGMGAKSLVVPTKLCRVRESQDLLVSIVEAGANRLQRLSTEQVGGRIWVLFGERRLGHIWDMHTWAWALVAAGGEVFLSRITGGEEPWRMLGCNVLFAHVARAIRAVGRTPEVADMETAQGDGVAAEPDWPAIYPKPALPRGQRQ